MRSLTEEKSEVTKKLQKQISNVEALKASLEQSEKKKDGMLSILGTFENRLTRLEGAIMPIYKETGNLKRRHENIEKTVAMLDKVIGYYHAPEEAESTINDGPSEDLGKYLQCLDKLEEANSFLKSNNCESTTTDHVMSLFDSGVSSLLKEFQNLLGSYSKFLDVQLLVNMVEKEEEPSIKGTDDMDQSTLLKPYPEKVLKSLIEISKWMASKDLSDKKGASFIDVFVNIRSQALSKALIDLRDYKIGSRENLHNMQSPMSKYKHRTTPKKYAKGKVTSILKNRESSSNRTSAGTTGVTEEDIEEDSLSLSITIPCLLKLLKAEELLSLELVPESYRGKVKSRLVHCGVDFLLKRTETLRQSMLRTSSKQTSNLVLLTLPVLRQLHQHQEEYNAVFKNCDQICKEKFQAMLDILHEMGRNALEEYINVIRNDPDKGTNMPKDGTVHELTSNSMFFMEQLLENSDVVGKMLLSKEQQDASLIKTTEEEKPRLKLAEFFTKVLSSLGLNLNNKANNLTDFQAIKAIFMLNNFNYVLNSLKRSGMMDIIHLWNAEVESFYTKQIINQKKNYSQSWSKVLHYISENQKPVSLHPPLDTKLKDRERNNIKDLFNGFNKEFDEIFRQQRSFAIPDLELRKSMINDNKSFIMPYYSAFLQRYQNSGFTKNPEKYIRYSEKDVETAMDCFFQA